MHTVVGWTNLCFLKEQQQSVQNEIQHGTVEQTFANANPNNPVFLQPYSM